MIVGVGMMLCKGVAVAVVVDVATAAAATAALTGQQWDGRWCHRVAADR